MKKKHIKPLLILVGLVASASLLSGCKIFGGVMVHNRKLDGPEYGGSNPLGFLRAETDDGRYFCQHTSSIPDTEKGYGLNTCGIKTRLY